MVIGRGAQRRRPLRADEHVAGAATRSSSEHALMSICASITLKERGEDADVATAAITPGTALEEAEPRDHYTPRSPWWRRGSRRTGGGSGHGVGQPDVERELRALPVAPTKSSAPRGRTPSERARRAARGPPARVELEDEMPIRSRSRRCGSEKRLAPGVGLRFRRVPEAIKR